MNNRTKKLTTLAMFIALAFAAVALGRIPVVLFLKYDPKDVIIVISGFVYGPLSAFAVSVIVSFIEMITISQEGIIGFMMNVLSSTAFAVTASLIYKNKRTIKGAIFGLLSGVAVMCTVMLLWNYIMVPIYNTSIPRETVAKMLLPTFLPFNLIKGGLNMAVTLFLYKPVVKVMKRAKLIDAHGSAADSRDKLFVIVLASVILVAAVVSILFIKGIL